MNQQELQEKVKEVFSDKAYVEGLLKLETPEEVQASLKEKGVEFSIQDILKAKDLLAKSENGELSDEELESVTGGIGLAALAIIAAVNFCITLGAACTQAGTSGKW